MNSLEEIRQVVSTAINTAHNVSYSSVPVVWPNFDIVDFEHMPDTVVSVELNVGNKVDVAGIGDTEIWGEHEVFIYYLRPEGTGLTGAMAYSDMLLSSICNRKINGIQFLGLRSMTVRPYRGVVGKMNAIKFLV